MSKIKKLNLNNKLTKLSSLGRQKRGWLIVLLIFAFSIFFKFTPFVRASYDADLFVTRWQTNIAGATDATNLYTEKTFITSVKDIDDVAPVCARKY